MPHYEFQGWVHIVVFAITCYNKSIKTQHLCTQNKRFSIANQRASINNNNFRKDAVIPELNTTKKIVTLKMGYGMTWRSRIRASIYNYENNQQDALYRLIYYSKSALHVSGDVFANYREHLTVFTVSGSVHASCCRLVPAATCVNTTYLLTYSMEQSPSWEANQWLCS
jgi:hypothetical protein